MTTGDAPMPPMPPVPVKHEVAARVECPDPDSKGEVASDFTDGQPSRLQKTELTHTTCATSQLSIGTHEDIFLILPNELHLSTGTHEDTGKIAYIDTEGTLASSDPEKLVKIADRLGIDATPVIENTVYARAYTYEDMEDFLSGLQAKMEKEPFKMLDFRTQIRVSYPNSCFYLHASPDDRINQLLQIIAKRISLSQESFYLTYLGRKLDPGSTLRELGLVVSLITFELHLRLRGGCPDKGNLSLREFIANNSVSWSTMSRGKKLYSNRLVKEVLVRYPAQKGMQQLVKVAMQPLAILICNGILHHVHMAHDMDRSWNGSISLETFRMIGGVMVVSQPALKDLDETSVHEDYKRVSELFREMLELNKNHPIYLIHLCSQMETADVTSAKSNTFQLFLRVHPALMTYSTRSSLLWEMQREMDGLPPHDKSTVQSAVDQIQMSEDWRVNASTEAVFLPTYHSKYKISSSDCFRFLQNWLTHGKENFNMQEGSQLKIWTEDMDYLLEIFFKNFLADLVWKLLQQNIGNLNRWFEDVQENNSF